VTANAQQQPLQPKRIFSGSVETARGLQSDCLLLLGSRG